MRTGRCLAIFGFPAWVMVVPIPSFAEDSGECPSSISRSENPNDQVVSGYEIAVVGEDPNYSCAAKLFEMAAREGSAVGAFNPGVMYARGLGVHPNDKKAVHWFKKAAESGLPDAQYNLGVRYSQGLGVQPDDKQAVHWFAAAAKAGLPDAQYNPSVRYLHGRGQIKDDAEAYKWFNLAAAAGNIDASEARDLIAWKMTSEQIAETQRRSRKWHDENGDGSALKSD